MRRLQLLLWLIPAFLFATAEEQVARHLQLRDARHAAIIARESLKSHPNNQKLWKLYIQALCQDCQVKEALLAFREYQRVFPEFDRDLTEALAWSVIRKGNRSTSPIVRLYGTIAAILSQDTKGILLIRKRLEDQNAIIRKVTATLASHLPDHTIHDQMFERLQKELDPSVKLELVKSLSKVKYQKLKPYLFTKIAQNDELKTHIQAFFALTEEVNVKQIEHLARSQKSGLRLLSCQLTAHFAAKEALPTIKDLLSDSNPNVRAAAIHAIAPLVKRPVGNLDDRSASCAIAAAWANTLHSHPKSETLFTPWITHQKQEVRLEAAAALARSGPAGVNAMHDWIKKSSDPYVKMTLATGLIGERMHLESAIKALNDGLRNIQGRLSMRSYEIGEAVIPNRLASSEQMLDMAEGENQMTRLKLIHLLSAVDSIDAKESFRQFLEKRSNVVTSFALTLLMNEGDNLSLETVQELLNHDNEEVQIQAAIMVGSWFKSDDALTLLHTHLKNARREKRQEIVEGLGQIADKRSLPNLLEVLYEPYPTMQIIAASSILQCLYR